MISTEKDPLNRIKQGEKQIDETSNEAWLNRQPFSTSWNMAIKSTTLKSASV